MRISDGKFEMNFFICSWARSAPVERNPEIFQARRDRAELASARRAGGKKREREKKLGDGKTIVV
jgi:hypothetical protein